MRTNFRLLLTILVLALLFVSGCAGGAHKPSTANLTESPGNIANLDADHDGVPDQSDECSATPAGLEVDAFGCPVPLYMHVVVPHGPEAPLDAAMLAEQLKRIATLLRTNTATALVIQGHTAPGVSPESDQARSQVWADQIGSALVNQYGIPKARISTQGLGASRPMVSNATAAGRRRNQRLELTLTGHYAALDKKFTPINSEQKIAAAATVQTPLPADSRNTASRLAPKAPKASPITAFGAAKQLHFDYGGTDLISQDESTLQQLGQFLQQHPATRISLVGHTDSKGSEAFNLKLSQRRARQIKEMLVARYGVAASRIDTNGKGESAPIADNATEAGRLANRRVTVTLQATDTAPVVAAAASAPTVATTADMPQTATKTREIPRTMQEAASATETPLAALRPNATYRIKISVKQCKLWLYELGADGAENLVRTYTVATPRPGLRGPEGLGTITRIDFNPWWVPTANLKRAALRRGKRLPDRVRPSSPANPMGKFKIHLSHGVALRIHGTNQPRLIGQRVSAGCIRMRNEQGLEMAKAVSVGTEVLVVD